MDIVSKINGNTLSATEFNQIPTELEAVQTSSGQTSSDAILDQVSIGISRYSANNFYIDSGAANAYILTLAASMTNPVNTTVGYFTGMTIRFRAGNANTGASTVNVNGAGVKSIKQADGTTNPSAAMINTNFDTIARYNGTVFVIQYSAGSSIGNVPVIGTSGYLLKSVQVFTSSGTWTKPANINAVVVDVQGAGGGGGGAAAGSSNGGGGSGGGFSRKFITSGLGTTETVTIGAAGSGGSVGNGGTAGGTSSFGSHCSATGGGKGNSNRTSDAPGVGSGGYLNLSGGKGNGGRYLSATDELGGGGGGAPTIGVAGGTDFVVNGTAAAALTEGGGGNGGRSGSSGSAGGAGGAGLIIVYEYV